MLGLYREDLNKRHNGAPIYIGDMTFFVRRWGDEESLKVRRDLEREIFGPFHSKQQGDENVLIAHWLVEYGVVGWENVIDIDEKTSIKYSQGTARKIFLNPEYYLSLNAKIFIQCGNFENFLYEDAQEDYEDLKKP